MHTSPPGQLARRAEQLIDSNGPTRQRLAMNTPPFDFASQMTRAFSRDARSFYFARYFIAAAKAGRRHALESPITGAYDAFQHAGAGFQDESAF